MTLMSETTTYDSLVALYRDKCLLDSAAGVLGWDERTYLPPKGSAFRADQMALLAKLSHEKLTSPKIGDLLGQLETTSLSDDQKVNVREIRRVYDRAVKMPARLVEEIARVTTQAQQVWAEARKASNFAAFAPWL